VVVVVPDAGVLFAGDLLESHRSPGYRDAFPASWAVIVTDRLLPLVRTAVVPGHGRVVDRAFAVAQAADLEAMAALGARVVAAELDDEEAIRLAPFPAETAQTALGRSAIEAHDYTGTSSSWTRGGAD
jgi:glyoxylase-like metal-dependent hydrolase (beta-lactamase superfamily II)